MRFRRRLAKPGPVWTFALVAIGLLTSARPALARAGGIVAGNCYGCHGGTGSIAPELTLSAQPATFQPGDAVTLTLAIRSPSIHVGGAFITAGGVGLLQTIAGQGLAVNAQGLTHTAPRAAVDGAVTFQFGWRAPAKAGSVVFGVAAVAGNGNNASTGDSPGAAEFQWVFGCEARDFYPDLDRDGFGSQDLGKRIGCTELPAPVGYATMAGDCDENSEKVHPDATEICNKKDDDCDGQVDEDAPPVMMWPDADGDGYYESQTGSPKLGCGNVAGYAPNGGDCNGAVPTINPGAAELCNNVDDDCDGDVDELVRPSCGVGWCSRYSPTCDASDCRPGPPASETCNRFDDDCDGEDDNGACPAGMSCSNSECVSNDDTLGPAPGPSDSSSAGTAPVTSGAPSANPAARRDSGCTVQGGQGPAGGVRVTWLLGWLLCRFRAAVRRQSKARKVLSRPALPGRGRRPPTRTGASFRDDMIKKGERKAAVSNLSRT